MIKFLSVFLIFLSPKVFAVPIEPVSGHYQAIKEKGFLEVGNPLYLQEDYHQLYRCFDDWIDLMTEDEALFLKMKSIEEEFLSFEELRLRYCSTPPSYRDPIRDMQKKHNKIYFQFIKEHYDLLQEKYPDLLQRCPKFFEEMMRIDQLAKKIFLQVLEELAQDSPGIKETLFGKHKSLSVVSKIVRYKKTDQWGTTPHFDKSGLSLIWDSSDINHDSLVLCSDSEHPSIAKLSLPFRKFTYEQGLNSVILIPGSCLSRVGYDIKPTLHGVLPIKQEYRYAVISFALIPDIDTKDIPTDYIEQ